ncbi:MAG: hypothetical protein WD080_10625 [Egibacteraceae bacterium]
MTIETASATKAASPATSNDSPSASSPNSTGPRNHPTASSAHAYPRAFDGSPFTIELAGSRATVGYEPGESATWMFGGNSNWRGPVWFPLNSLLIKSLRRFHRFSGADLTVELPTGSGHQADLAGVADQLSRRLIGLFCDDEHGRRPAFGTAERLQTDPTWHDRLLFSEYFHGDTGAGLGASHQTDWTGLVADLIVRRHAGPAADAPTDP